MRKIRVFAPATVANMGCGFDIMGMTLDAVGDVLSVEIGEGDSLTIINNSKQKLPEDIEQNVITPAVRAFMKEYGVPMSITVTVEHKIAPGSGIGSSGTKESGTRTDSKD